jgi:hypothetical protein
VKGAFSEKDLSGEGYERLMDRIMGVWDSIEKHEMPFYIRIEKRKNLMNYELEYYKFAKRKIEQEMNCFYEGNFDSFSLN